MTPPLASPPLDSISESFSTYSPPPSSPRLRRHSTLRPTQTNDTYRSTSAASEDPERPRPPRPPSPDHVSEEDNAPPPMEEVTRSRFIAHYAILVLASMLGCLIRLGLEGLSTYDGQIIYSLAWVQGVGCGIMGLALARKNDIIWVYPPLYTFFTTGIAGSVTTFSSWMLEGYQAFSNFNDYNRKGLHDTVDGLAYSFSTFAISLSCLKFGEHVSALLPTLHPSLKIGRPVPLQEKQQPSPSSSSSASPGPPTNQERITPFADFCTIITALLAYLIVLLLYFLGPKSWRHTVIFPLLLSPPGAILRFAFARLNPLSPFIDRFPLGTFIVNIVATLVIAGSVSGQYVVNGKAQSHATTCNALYGIQQGFCGCLSTVSTFVVESRSIRGKRWKWGYVVGSVILGHLMVLTVLGGVGWGEGYGDVCSG